MHRIVDDRTGAVLVGDVAVPRRFGLASARGLLGREGIARGHGLLLRDPLRAVHTFGMRFAIDVVFLDRSLRVVAVRTAAPPGRVLWHPRGAWQLELAAGGAARAGLRAGRRTRLMRGAVGGGGRDLGRSPQDAAESGEPADERGRGACAGAGGVLLIPPPAASPVAEPERKGHPPCAPTC